jgi:hypothetical protein
MRNSILIIVSVLLLVVYFSTGCKKEEDTTNEFLVKIDSIQMADTIDFGSALDVNFFGLIGTNDCYSFSRFEQVQAVVGDPDNSIRIQTYGKFEDNGNCQPATVYMNPVTLQITGMFAGTFRVLAIQPDGTILTAVCYVKE